MSHPPHRIIPTRTRAGLIAILLLCLAAPPAFAGSWVEVKTNVGNVEMLFYTDAPALGAGLDTVLFTNLGTIPLQLRSGRVRRALPILESLLGQDPRGMIFHRADASHVYTGVIKQTEAGGFKVINQDGRERFPTVELPNGSKIGSLTQPVMERGDIVLAYTTVRDRKRTAFGNTIDAPVRGHGFRFAITTVGGQGMDRCSERFDLGAPAEMLDGIPTDRPFFPDEYDCAIAIVGRVVKGMDVIDTIATSPQIHGFFGIDSPKLGGFDNQLVHELGRLPLQTPILQPDPNEDGTSLFGCASVFEPTPLSGFDPRVNATNCTTAAESLTWLANRRATFGPEIAENLIKIRKAKLRPSLRGSETIQFNGGAVTQIGTLFSVVHPAEWLLRVEGTRDGDAWKATDHEGLEYSGTLNRIGENRFRLRPDADSKLLFEDRWKQEVETQAVEMMKTLRRTDGRRRPEDKFFPLVDSSESAPVPEASAFLQAATKPRIVATINPDNGLVEVSARMRLLGDLRTVTRMFSLTELGSRLEGRIRPIDVAFELNVRGLLIEESK